MKKLRSAVFWAHLLAGTAAGLVILVMSATGAMLALKTQILNRIEHDARFVQPTGAPRLGASQLLAAARASHPDAQPMTLVQDRDPAASTSVSFGRDTIVYVNPYTGAVLGEGSKRAQGFFRSAEDWHRYLSVSGDSRPTARAITGAANIAFLCLAISGLFMWWPRKWTPQHRKAILAFKSRAKGRAREFNWHNVIGFWCAPIIIILTLTGVVMSYPWANNLLYRAMGSTPPQAAAAAPARTGGPGGGARRDRAAAPAPVDFDLLWAHAARQLPAWRTMTMRLAARPGGPVSFTISDAQNWNAYARSQLTLDAVSGAVTQWQPYEATSLGQKARGWVRFGHTGELGGVGTQVLAGTASLGGVFLVWTGLSLAVRRLFGWRIWKSLTGKSPELSWSKQ